jgi:hypothetical protein
MTSRTVVRTVAALALGAALLPAEADAQSIFATRGLGFPLEAQDARGQGMGGVMLGLPGPQISWANPAAAVGLIAPGVVLGYQFDNFTAQGAGIDASGTSARFPLMLGAFPAGERMAFSVGYGSFLEQNWRAEQPDTLLIFGETVPVVDIATSTGGVARFRVAGAYRVLEGLSAGLGLDVYTGTSERLEGRVFPGEPEPACCRAAWNYGGVGVTGGLHWSPGDDTGVGISVTHGGSLDASPREGTAGAALTYSLPLTARLGGSGRVGQNMLVAVAGDWSGWSILDSELAGQGGARDTWSARGGVEWDGLVVRERPVPVRVGGRTAALPFRWRDAAGATEWASERALSLGAGIVFAGGATQSDFAVEFGNRGGDAAGVDESYWRFAFSVRVLGR